MDPRLNNLSNRIGLLASVDVGLDIFGASTHGYAFAGPADPAPVEDTFGPLPASYRAFVAAFGVRGAGPYYGRLPPAPPTTIRGVADPRAPFPHDRALDDASECSLDGTLVLADQGCGGRSLLVLSGPHAGEVWSDWSEAGGGLGPEAVDVVAWYERWLDGAALEWLEYHAARLGTTSQRDANEDDAIGVWMPLVVDAARDYPDPHARTLGYLHLRAQRWSDAVQAFDAAAAVGRDEPAARRALDLARVARARGELDRAIDEARAGLSCTPLWGSTENSLHDLIEDTALAAGRHDEAIASMRARADDETGSMSRVHRLARALLSRGDTEGARAALAAAVDRVDHIDGEPSTRATRIIAAFAQIEGELRQANRIAEAEVLGAWVERELATAAN